MKASILDLRRRPGEILRALEQNEPVIIFYRGKKKGVIYPAPNRRKRKGSVKEHPAFGMWKNRRDLRDVGKAVRVLRKERFNAL